MPRLTTAQHRREVESTRHIIHGLDHDEARLVHRALDAYGAMLTAVDRDFPNPDQRALAEHCQTLAKRFQDANTARSFVEGEETS